MIRRAVLAAALVVAGSLFLVSSAPAQEARSGFGGPSSVDAGLAKLSRVPLSDRFHLGFDYSAMGQIARGGADEESASGVARIFGTVDLYGGAGSSTGTVTFKLENRHAYGDLAPQDLGFAVGYVGLPAITFSDAGTLLTNLFWQHTSADGRWAFVAGITDVTDYVDVYALGNPWAEFSNLSFSTNPTIPAPNQGFGLAARLRIGRNGYVLAGIADANGDPADPIDSLSDFFADPEIFAHAEIGWVGSWEDRFTDNLHLTLWSADARPEAGVPSGHGAALSASWRFGERFIPYARIGYSDGGGALLERAASIGLGYDTGRRDDRIGIGVSWGKPNSDSFGDNAREQVTAESYWRLRASDWLEITSDVQYLRRPALAPDIDHAWLLGLRLQASF